jgi:hypothetical protein
VRRIAIAVVAAALGAGSCAHEDPHVSLTEDWPAHTGDYDDTTAQWTRRATLRGAYQEVLGLTATFKSPEWRAAHAEREARLRKLNAEGRASLIAQSQADAAGPYELELMVATWDRRENDLHRGKRSVWRVVLIDDAGKEIEPLEITRDRRPTFVVRTEFPALADFAEPYIARFPRTEPLLGPGVHALRLRMTSERGGVEVAWQ